MRILVVEDDNQTATLVGRALLEDGHSVDVVLDGKEGLKLAAVNTYDVLVVDRMLPGLDGLSIVRSLRSADVKSAVIFLTSLGAIEDRIEGLEGGGDDYLVKPFALGELVARVNALGRRPALMQEDMKKLIAYSSVAHMGFVTIGIFAAKGFATYGGTVTLSRIGNRIVANNQRAVFSKLLSEGLNFFSDRHSTEFIARLSTGAAACTLPVKGKMKLVQPTDADRALLKKVLQESILPKWAARCSADCVKSFNDTIGKTLNVTASK